MNDVDGFCRALLEYKDLKPWEHYNLRPKRKRNSREPILREEIIKFLEGVDNKDIIKNLL